MLYFSYGSNMYTGRLRSRTPSATIVSTARLDGYALRFHKRSTNDGSAKCSIKPEKGSAVYGVLFDIPEREKSALDRAEGLGYGYRKEKINVDAEGETKRAFTYIASATHVDDALRPYRWYKRLVIEGAREHGLPRRYIEAIEKVNAIRDPDSDRRSRELAILEP